MSRLNDVNREVESRAEQRKRSLQNEQASYLSSDVVAVVQRDIMDEKPVEAGHGEL